MADMKPKPNAFSPGQRGLSASDLNKVRDATPRLIKGGDGVASTKFGDKVVFRQLVKPSPQSAATAIMIVVVEHNDYVECNFDGALTLVAKPVGLRGVTGYYEVDEEVLAARVPSARIAGEGGELITWVIARGARGEAGVGTGDTFVSATTKAGLPASTAPKIGYTTGVAKRYYIRHGSTWDCLDFLE